MPIPSRTLPTILLLILAALLGGTGCSDDDPVTPDPQPPLWQEVDLGSPPVNSRLMAIDINGAHGWAVGGNNQSSSLFYQRQPDGAWTQQAIPGMPLSFFAMGLTLEDDGRMTLAGFNFAELSQPSMVYDLRGENPQTITRPGGGIWALDGQGDFLVAGGFRRGGDLWTSNVPGLWSIDDLPLTGTNDSGFRDVHVVGDHAVACGFDDGADQLQVILTRTKGSGWTHVDLSAAGFFAHTFRAVALTRDGAIFVGGIVGAGGPAPEAFLSIRSASGEWTAIILPEPVLLGGVNDILIAADGSVYLACSGEIAPLANGTVVHASESGVAMELPVFAGEVLRLAEGDDGAIYAVGLRYGDPGDRAVMFQRQP